jgi:hypothetical protein
MTMDILGLVYTESIEIIFRGPGFIAVECLAPSPPPPLLLLSASCISFSVFLCVAWSSLSMGEEGGGGAKSYARKKAWPSINHSFFLVISFFSKPDK